MGQGQVSNPGRLTTMGQVGTELAGVHAEISGASADGHGPHSFCCSCLRETCRLWWQIELARRLCGQLCRVSLEPNRVTATGGVAVVYVQKR
jgi:hypothetical protein